MGKPLRSGKKVSYKRPRFAYRKYETRTRTLKGLPRTTNRLEATHRALQLEIGQKHPSVWKLIDALRAAQRVYDVELEHFLVGKPGPQQKCDDKLKDVALFKLVADNESAEPEATQLEFLRGLAGVHTKMGSGKKTQVASKNKAKGGKAVAAK